MVSNSRKILVVDDEPKIVDVVRSYLESSGYEVLVAYSGIKALEIFEKESPSLIVLDLMLPDLAGEEICTVIRKKSRTPIIMLTAKIEENDILAGLNLGADDYLRKPFSPKELIARIDAVLRRVTQEIVPLVSRISFNDGELVIDSLRHEVRKCGEAVQLTPQELKILMTMIKHPTKVFTREELLSFAFANEYEVVDRIIDSHIKNIRQKIEDNTRHPKYILTIHGVGYKFGGV